MSASEEIRDLVRRLNAAWVAGRFEELGECFHQDVVIVAPDFVHRVMGREACVQSYRDFVSQAVVHDVELREVQVDVFGGVAVAACPYTMEYELGGKRWRGDGRDLLVLAQEASGWLVVWRTLMAGPEEEVESDVRPE
ncbi:MAG: YybH family protein [Longimicrobiales bacterium]